MLWTAVKQMTTYASGDPKILLSVEFFIWFLLLFYLEI